MQPPANSPAAYMNDPAFREQLEAKRKELQAIVKEREPLAKRMEELVKQHGKELSKLQGIPEWRRLHKQVVALNEKYEEVRQRQLKVLRDKMTPPKASEKGKEISK